MTNAPFPRVSGDPSMIQGHFGQKGNFEMVVPLADGGLAAFARYNDDPAHPWYRSRQIFGQDLGRFDSVTLIESNFGADGRNLELVARKGDQLYFSWRPDRGGPSGTPGPWQPLLLMEETTLVDVPSIAGETPEQARDQLAKVALLLDPNSPGSGESGYRALEDQDPKAFAQAQPYAEVKVTFKPEHISPL